jgi:hypothetical protein
MKLQILNKLQLSYKLKQSLCSCIQEDRRRGFEYRNCTRCQNGTNYTWDFQPFLTSKYTCQTLCYSNERIEERTDKINTSTSVF